LDLHLDNSVILVAGSSRGIGKAIATVLLEEGCRVCITGRDADALSKTELEFESRFGTERIRSVCGDLSQADSIAEALIAVKDKWGGIDGLVANLGTGSGVPGWNQAEEEWERLFQINFQASVRLAQATIPLLIERGGGNIVFISSITGVEATPAPLPYSAAKAALINYGKNLSRQVANNNIRVNCIAPGNILFPGGSWERHLRTRHEAIMEGIRREVPMARFGTPEEIASLTAFLCSGKASFVTGACFVADGGQTRSL
jgi:3-oxoacyl-[acyl-carrier protein] reductase